MGIVYITRHGETDFNIEKKVTGTVDIPLNDNGIIQAENSSKNFPVRDLDLIISSPLKRAFKTAEIFSNNLKVNLKIDDRLKEIDLGVFQGEYKSTVFRENRDLFELHKKDLDCISHGGESINMAVSRVYNFLESLKSRYGDKKVLIVAHTFIFRAIHSYFKFGRWDLSCGNLKLGNCDIKEYKFKI